MRFWRDSGNCQVLKDIAGDFNASDHVGELELIVTDSWGSSL